MWRRALRRIQRLEGHLPATANDLYGPVFERMREFIEASRGVPPHTVAAVIASALASRRPRPYYAVGVDARLRLVLERLPTRVRDFLIASQLPEYPAAD